MEKRQILPLILSFGSAVLLWLAFPGSGGMWYLMPVALVPLLLGLLLCRRERGAAIVGFVTGLLHYHLQMYWIVSVLGQYGGLGWFLSSQALLLLATYMSLYLSLFCYLAHRLLRLENWLIPLFVLPALWAGLEWLKGVLFTGFPWMDLGYSLSPEVLLIQSADLWGHLGLSYLIVFVNVFLVLLATSQRSLVSRAVLILVAGGVVGSVLGYSANRLEQVTASETTSEDTFVAGIAQGNIDQSLKWSQDMQQKTVDGYLRLTQQLAEGALHPELVVWPETALPFYPENNPYLARIGEKLVQENVHVLTGAPMYEIVDPNTRDIRFFNSALLLDGSGDLSVRYDKSHLVPFGEYVPFREFLPFIAPLVESVGDFSQGAIAEPLAIGQARLGVLICFESVFPAISRKWVEQGANVLVNLTNDAWYGNSSAPHHSLAMTVLRAVENRRSLIRSANTGISAFIAPSGKVIESSELFTEWSGAARVKIASEKTCWGRWGYLFGPLCAGVLLLALGERILYSQRKKQLK